MSDGTPLIRLEGVGKKFGEVAAVDDVTLDIGEGEFFSLLGASGSGKTTLLRLIGGFETPDTGRIFIDGIDMTETSPYARPTNMVFQSYALFPHMSVTANVAFGLRRKGFSRADAEARAAETLSLVQLDGLGDRKPDQLSGGQRQRVALARALVMQPKVLLLDEPLSALDQKLREYTQFELKRLQQQLGITFVLVTHDQDEAMAMSTRIAVMDRGRVVETGAPREIYDRPQTRFVADFMGGANIFDAEPAENGCIALPKLGIVIAAEDALAAAGWVALRPERIALHKTAPAEGWPSGIVEAAAFHGDFSRYRIRLESGEEIRVTAPTRASDPAAGDRVFLSWAPDAPVVLKQ